MADLPTFDVLAAQLHTRFLLEPGVELELIEAVDLGSTPVHEQFSLLFRGPGGRPLPQRIYGLRHAVLGTFSIFIVPVGRDAQGVLYEAVFNRPRVSTGA